MLCEIDLSSSFLVTWAILSVLGVSAILLSSGIIFKLYYWKPTYEQWQMKINAQYPPADKVRDEVVQTLKSILVATFCPALSLWLTRQGYSQAYCGVEPHGWGHIVLSFFVIWFGTDLWEFTYHYIGHTTAFGWEQHKPHHVFYNPSPFAVIADEALDQFVRSAPLLLLPVVMPMNMDLLFFTFAIFFYGYGVYLHWGFELKYPNAHHPWINTAFQHYAHHAKSMAYKPYHCGFFFKLWDNIMGSVWDKECFCVQCITPRGERSREAWKQVSASLPDYSPLLRPSFWAQHPLIASWLPGSTAATPISS